MQGVHVFLIGDTLFANVVADMLLECPVVRGLDSFPSIAAALPLSNSQLPDVLILVDADPEVSRDVRALLPICSEVPIICANHRNDFMKLVVTTHLPARLSELLDVITGMDNI